MFWERDSQTIFQALTWKKEDKMENFELIFEVDYNCSPPFPPPYKLSRVIMTEDLRMARQIAEAMLGEEVDAGDFLSRVVEVRKTNKAPELPCWGDDNKVWCRVLKRLRVTSGEVEFIFSGRQKVGLFRGLKC
jgi:hypothetical protein